MEQPVYFISDVHLQFADTDISARQIQMLHSFLDEVESRRGILYIVGDLFDFWFEYRHVIPRKYFSTLSKLYDITSNGGEVHYLTGNHDFWLNDFFTSELNIKIYREPLETTIQGVRLLIIHGDGLLKNDRGYRLLKKVLRHPVPIFFFRLIHPDWGFKVARRVSRRSRIRGEKEEENIDAIRTEITEWAKSRLSSDFDAVIMGHYHQVIHEQYESGHFINLGDWIRHFTFACLYKSRLTLNHWNPKSSPEKIR